MTEEIPSVLEACLQGYRSSVLDAKTECLLETFRQPLRNAIEAWEATSGIVAANPGDDIQYKIKALANFVKHLDEGGDPSTLLPFIGMYALQIYELSAKRTSRCVKSREDKIDKRSA